MTACLYPRVGRIQKGNLIPTKMWLEDVDKETKEQLLQDIEVSLTVWETMLREYLSNDCVFIFAKGSAVKPWDDPIDYVPIISDVDIHVRLSAERVMFPQQIGSSLDASLWFTETYEERFWQANPSGMHLPRVQVVNLNVIERNPSYVPPRASDLRVLFGEVLLTETPEASVVRRMDRKNLLADLKEFVRAIPEKMFDRSGVEFYTLLRQMNWRVSPSPFRLLTQVLTDVNPLDVWTWNRSKVCTQLVELGYKTIASHYRGFYLAGWDLFSEGFSSPNPYRRIISEGYQLLRLCLETVEELH